MLRLVRKKNDINVDSIETEARVTWQQFAEAVRDLMRVGNRHEAVIERVMPFFWIYLKRAEYLAERSRGRSRAGAPRRWTASNLVDLWTYIECQKARTGKTATAIIKELAKDGGVEIDSWDYRGPAGQQFQTRVDKPDGLKKAYESAGALLKRSPGANRFFHARVTAQINANGNVSAIDRLNELIPDEFQGQKDEGPFFLRVYERRQFWIEELNRLHLTAGKPAAARNNRTRL
jgi:hypothetical protein